MALPLDGKLYLQKLQTFAYLCLGLPLLFFIYLYLESSVDQLTGLIAEDHHMGFLIVMTIVGILIIFVGIKKRRQLLEEAMQKEKLVEKLKIYRLSNNLRFLSYGLSSSIVTIGFYLTNFQAFAALFGIMIVLFSIHNPNSRKIVTDLKLKGSEKEILINGLEIPE